MNTPAITLSPAAGTGSGPPAPADSVAGDPVAGDSVAGDPGAGATGPPGTGQVEIVVPVRDEEAGLAPSVRRLHAFLAGGFPFPAHLTIADNGSTDRTWEIATGLAAELANVSAVRLAEPGRGGRCARSGWPASATCWPTWTSTCPPT